MLVKLGVSAMADICIWTAREIQKCGQLKSLLLKGKKKVRSSTEKARTEAQRDCRATLGIGKSQSRRKHDLQGHRQMTFTPFTRLKGNPQSSPRVFFPHPDSRIIEHNWKKKASLK